MQAKYNTIGVGYNNTRKADPFLLNRILALLKPRPNGVYLDLGCGTGNYSHEIQQRGFSLIGIDPSEKMLAQAKLKNQKIEWKLGQAEKIELPNASIDGALCTLTLHHWQNLAKGFSELQRVLKPGGKLLIFTSTPKQMQGYWLNHYFPKMLADSIEQMPEFLEIENAMKQAPLEIIETEKYFIKPDLQDQFLYCGKQNPELYLNPNNRQGISSFSALANQEEVETGLEKLKKDIDSGDIKSLIKSYENDWGDYLFILGKKSA